MEQVGMVTLKVLRIYPLDPYTEDPLRTTVIVQPGSYPLYRNELGGRLWLMDGHINKRGFFRLGDGVSEVYQSDVASEIPVTFPSRVFGPDEWLEMVASEWFVERFEVWESANLS